MFCYEEMVKESYSQFIENLPAMMYSWTGIFYVNWYSFAPESWKREILKKLISHVFLEPHKWKKKKKKYGGEGRARTLFIIKWRPPWLAD